MDIREATGSDCVWYQEHIQKGTSPNAAELISRLTDLTEEMALSLPARKFWPLYTQCQEAIAEGFTTDPTD